MKDPELKCDSDCLSRLPPGLGLYAVAVVAALLISLCALFWDAHTGQPLLRERLWSQGPDRFGDFWHYRALFATFHTRAFFTSPERFAYPAPCALIYSLLYSLGYYKHLFFNILLWSTEAATFVWLLRAWRSAGLCWLPATLLVCLIALTSHPWHMLYDRGNIELFVYLLIAPGFLAFLAGRHHLAASLWGAAAALKLFPILLLVVYLSRRTLKPLLVGLTVCLAILLFSFWYVGPTFSIAAVGTFTGIHGFTQHYGGMARRDELPLDHSLLASVKQLTTLRSKEIWIGQATVQKGFYATLALVLPFAWFRHFRELRPLNRVCVLLCAVMLLPPVSYDYTLIYSYLVFAVVSVYYIHSARDGAPVHQFNWLLSCFAVLATPQTWFRIGPFEGNGMVKCIALVTILVLLASPSWSIPDTSQLAADS